MTDFITSRFRRAVDQLLALEGGYVDHPNDRGGPTKYGISQRAYPRHDIKNLTRDVAVDIYERDYWAPLKCDKFWSEKLAVMLFEFGANAGIARAAKALQTAINGLGRPISADGRVGPATVAAANQIPEDKLLEALRREILHHYRRLANIDPSQQIFLKGWENRLRAGQP